MRNSGHQSKYIKHILIRGILRYESKLRNSELDKLDPKYKPLHQPSGRFLNKMRKKAMAKSNWYRDQPNQNEVEDQLPGLKSGPKVKRGVQKKAIEYKKDGNEEVQISTVMCVPNTKGAILLKKLKGRENIMSNICGFEVKYVEAGGTQLIRLFNQDLGKGLHCGREVCPPCDTTKVEKRQHCRTRNIL